MRAWLARTAGGVSLVLLSAAIVRAEKLELPASVATPPVVAADSAAIETSAAAPAVLVEAPRPLRHGVFRFTSYPAAWTAAQKSNRPILVFASAPSCPHCVKMIGETYRSKQISSLVNESFETVYVDRSEQPELAAKLKIRWFPSTIVVAPNNQVIDVIEGYVDSATLNQRLKTSFAAHQSATQTR